MVFVASNNFFLEGRDERKKALCVTSPSAPLLCLLVTLKNLHLSLFVLAKHIQGRKETKRNRVLSVLAVRSRLSLCNKNLKQQQMQLRESIHSTKKLFHNTIQNLKSIFFGGYQKLTKHSSFNPFSCGSGNVRNYQTGQYYEDFFNELECDLEKAMKRKSSSLMGSEEPVRDEDVSNETDRNLANSPQRKKQGEKEEMNKKICRPKKAEEKSSKNMNESGYVLAQKMKELEMMDVSNVEHVLDVEEALHYYSRLKSPVYQDLVDEFFTDMYTEFSVPQAAASINSSKRRIESIRL